MQCAQTVHMGRLRGILVAGTCVSALIAGNAFAADEVSGANTVAGNGSEGTNIEALIVTAEKNPGAAAAPVKASLDQMQPESIISHRFIEQFTPETGDYTTVVLIAPSLSGISANGGGVGETNKISLRGFTDGQFNVTYDGIFYGDTNDPTHHPASFFPSSTIGAAVVDRGPGAAGDLGQANYGGAIHFFSPTISDAMGVSQKVTYGSFDTIATVTTLQSGSMKAMGGAKALVSFDQRQSQGQLSESGGIAQNGLVKITAPLGERGSVTLFSAVNYTRFYQSDAGPGETFQQMRLFGKNFGLNEDPTSPFYKGYNTQKKHSDFEYIDLRYDFGGGLTTENQGYTYFYSNKTISVNTIAGLPGTIFDKPSFAAPFTTTDIGGFNKANRYRVYGDILRVNKDFDHATVKAGVLVETSATDRHNILYDLTTGVPDLKYASATTPPVKNSSNIKTLEDSSWFQYQLFVDLELRPLKNLTLTPGFKYVNLERKIDAAIENSGVSGFTRGPVAGAYTYDKPLYFFTGNYKINPNWSVYGQYATGFLIPALSFLQVNNPGLNQLAPQESVNYQAGTVYSKGRLTADFDLYRIDISNLQQPDPTGKFYVNGGNARYSGFEGEVAYAFPFGLTLFANGSLNSGKSTTKDQAITNSPKFTDAFGALYDRGPWQGSLTFKQVGGSVAFYNGKTATTTGEGIVLAANQGRQVSGYNTLNASIAYDFGHYKVKFEGVNLNDNRSITSITGPSGASDLYTFQAGRQLQVTVQAKF